MSIFRRSKIKKNIKKDAAAPSKSFDDSAQQTIDKEKSATDRSKIITKATKRPSLYASRVLLHPLMTEKSTILTGFNQYAFMIDKKANKISVAKAIEEVYGIKPVSVNIMNNLGKQVRSGRRLSRRKNWKKAIITLPTGKTIDIYEH